MNPSERCPGEIRDGETQVQSSAAKRQRMTISSRAWLEMKFLIDAVTFFRINWDQSQGGQRKHLSTVGNRGLALLPKILSLELYSKKREKRESRHPNSGKGKAITFDQAELNFNPNCTSQSFPVISGQLSHQFKTWLYHRNKYLVHWVVERIMSNELTDAEMIRHHGHHMVGTG